MPASAIAWYEPHMRSSYLALCLVAVLANGCVRAQYVPIQHGGFHTETDARVLFPSLVRAAAQMGYVIYAVDPMTGVFQVYSRALRSRRARARGYGIMRTDLLVVTVAGGEVRVTAIGQHVSPDGTMHPRLAEEASMFALTLEDVARGTVSAPTMPEPPLAYGGLGAFSSAPVVSGAVVVPNATDAPPASAGSSDTTESAMPTTQATLSPAQRLGHP